MFRRDADSRSSRTIPTSSVQIVFCSYALLVFRVPCAKQDLFETVYFVRLGFSLLLLFSDDLDERFDETRYSQRPPPLVDVLYEY